MSSVVWIAAALAFGGVLWVWRGPATAGQYFAGYLLEKALSVDNVFVFVMLFASLQVPAALQRRVLRLGVLGALVLRGAFIAAGGALITHTRVERRFFRGAKGARRRAWAERWLERFGMPLIVVCRFIPGGRTAVTLCCGMVGYQRRRFVVATAVAGMIWAAYSFLIGRLGGRVFEDKPWAGLLLAFGVTLAVSGLIEVTRRIRSRR